MNLGYTGAQVKGAWIGYYIIVAPCILERCINLYKMELMEAAQTGGSIHNGSNKSRTVRCIQGCKNGLE